jgi:UDP-N-acetylglucosamine--N-acetylmuramyl-(pentapeptide) pyrophosphoryl-undecaprenol N-acetylglucosamine transferase
LDATNPPLHLAIAGGGTGGHVLPAVAVIQELRRRGRLADALWIGSADGLEGQAAADAGVRFAAIPTGKLRRYLSLQNVTDAARVPLGVLAARRALRRFRPDVVLSTGGFVSVPTVIAARGLAPVLAHEQTAVLGLATRINARFAAVLAISHERTRREAASLHRNVVVTGNPLREGLREGDRQRGLARSGFADSLPVVYVTGGARGASALNQRVAAMLPALLERTQLLHQTGPASANPDAARLTARREELPVGLRSRYRVVEFIGDDLPDVYAMTDLALGRAGAGTIAELAHVGLPAILIPLPGAGGDEQTANAHVLAEAGAALLIPQHEATPERLVREITDLLANPSRLRQMADAARTVSRPDAAARLSDVLIDLATAPNAARQSPPLPARRERGAGG